MSKTHAIGDSVAYPEAPIGALLCYHAGIHITVRTADGEVHIRDIKDGEGVWVEPGARRLAPLETGTWYRMTKCLILGLGYTGEESIEQVQEAYEAGKALRRARGSTDLRENPTQLPRGE